MDVPAGQRGMERRNLVPGRQRPPGQTAGSKECATQSLNGQTRTQATRFAKEVTDKRDSSVEGVLAAGRRRRGSVKKTSV